jgi:hypothetical protein
MSKKPTDFRYNTGPSTVPWAAVGESYTADDITDVVSFLLQGEGPAYTSALESVKAAVKNLATIGNPPGKLSLGERVTRLEQEIDLSSPMRLPASRLPSAMRIYRKGTKCLSPPSPLSPPWPILWR